MTNYLDLSLSRRELADMGPLALAHVGDSVYELLVRTYFCSEKSSGAMNLHRRTVALVRASAQAEAAAKISEFLTEEEQAVFRRGRNAKVNSIPKNARLADYHAATGLECLFGWLWLLGYKERINELFELIMEDLHGC